MPNPLRFVSFKWIELFLIFVILLGLVLLAFFLGKFAGDQLAERPDPTEVVKLVEIGAAPAEPVDEVPLPADLPKELRKGTTGVLVAEQELKAVSGAKIIGGTSPGIKLTYADVRLTPDNLGGIAKPHVFKKDGWWYVKTDLTVYADIEGGKRVSRGPFPADVTRIAQVAKEELPTPPELPRELVGIVAFPIDDRAPRLAGIYYPKAKWWGVGAGRDFDTQSWEVLFSARWKPG